MSRHINDVWKQSDNISNNVKDDNCAIDISTVRTGLGKIRIAYLNTYYTMKYELGYYYGPIIGLDDKWFLLD